MKKLLLFLILFNTNIYGNDEKVFYTKYTNNIFINVIENGKEKEDYLVVFNLMIKRDKNGKAIEINLSEKWNQWQDLGEDDLFDYIGYYEITENPLIKLRKSYFVGKETINNNTIKYLQYVIDDAIDSLKLNIGKRELDELDLNNIVCGDRNMYISSRTIDLKKIDNVFILIPERAK